MKTVTVTKLDLNNLKKLRNDPGIDKKLFDQLLESLEDLKAGRIKRVA